MKFRGVIFDLDGTLLDTLEDLADSVNAVLERRGLPPHPDSAYRYFVGRGFTRLAEQALPAEERRPDRIAELEAAARAEYAERWAAKTRPYPGIPELLDGLTGREVRLAILSNKPHEFTSVIVDRFLGRWNFQAVTGHRPGTAPKPDPAGARETCAILGLSDHEILYVGDTGTDMETAVNAGLTAAGVLWGFREREELLAAGAALLIAHPQELLDLF